MDTTQKPNAVEEAFARASGSWTGWDWAQDFAATAEGGQDVVVVLDGGEDFAAVISKSVARQVEDVAARADVAERLLRMVRAYAARVSTDAKDAQQAGEDALAEYRAGRLSRALEQARIAASTERTYGDAPTWGPLEVALRMAQEEAE